MQKRGEGPGIKQETELGGPSQRLLIQPPSHPRETEAPAPRGGCGQSVRWPGVSVPGTMGHREPIISPWGAASSLGAAGRQWGHRSGGIVSLATLARPHPLGRGRAGVRTGTAGGGCGRGTEGAGGAWPCSGVGQRAPPGAGGSCRTWNHGPDSGAFVQGDRFLDAVLRVQGWVCGGGLRRPGVGGRGASGEAVSRTRRAGSGNRVVTGEVSADRKQHLSCLSCVRPHSHVAGEGPPPAPRLRPHQHRMSCASGQLAVASVCPPVTQSVV